MAGIVAEVTDNNFQAEVSSPRSPCWSTSGRRGAGRAGWLRPSSRRSPRSARATLKVVKLNIDENQETAIAFNVMSIPTLILFRNGQVAKTVIGAYPKRKLEAELEPALA